MPKVIVQVRTRDNLLKLLAQGEVILDSIASEQVDPELTEAQQQELDQRIYNYDANPDDVLTWEEIKISIKGR